MSRKIKSAIRSDKIQLFLFGVIVAMAVMLIAMIIIRHENERRITTDMRVSLGSMQYDLSGGKATKRTDETVAGLRKFLIETAEKDTSENCTSYYSVIRASEDEKQVLLGYGCDYPSARMFAVNESGAWRTISPTGQFDMFGMPLCSHVDENAISKTIAPVCYSVQEGEGAQLTYTVR